MDVKIHCRIYVATGIRRDFAAACIRAIISGESLIVFDSVKIFTKVFIMVVPFLLLDETPFHL